MFTADELKKELNIKENSLKMYNKTRMDMLLRGADRDDCSEIEHQIEMLRKEIEILNRLSTWKDKEFVCDISSEKIMSNAYQVKFPNTIKIDSDYIKDIEADTIFKHLHLGVSDYVKRKNGYIEILGREIEKCINMPFDFDIEWYDKRGSLAYIEHYTGCKITNYYGNKCTADSSKEREFNITIAYEKLEYKAPVLEINKKSSNLDLFGNIKRSDNISISAKEYPDPFKTRIYW